MLTRFKDHPEDSRPAAAGRLADAASARHPSRGLSPRLALYVGAEILKVFGLIFLILEVIHGSVMTIQAVREYGFDPVLLFPIFWRIFAYSLYHSLPIALLLATGLVYGRLLADREVAAMKCFGISHLEMLLAPAGLGAAMAVAAFFVNHHLVPEIHNARRNLGTIILDQLQYLGEGWDKSFQLGDKLVLEIERYRNRKLYGIFIFANGPKDFGLDSPKSSYPIIAYAEEGEVKSKEQDGKSLVSLDLKELYLIYNHKLLNPKEKQDFFNRGYSSHLIWPIPIKGKDRVIKSMPRRMLVDEIDKRRQALVDLERQSEVSEAARRAARRDYLESKTEYHRRLTYASICFTFPVTAALIALLLNSTNRLLPFFIGATVCCSVFFPLEMQGNKLSTAYGAAWFYEQLGNAGLLAISALLYLWLEFLQLRFSGKRARRKPRRGVAHGP